MDVFKANVRIRSTAKALAILASHRREKYFVLEQYQSATFAKSTAATFHRKSGKSREKVEKRVGKSVKKKNLEKNENAGKKTEREQNFRGDSKLKV